MKQPLVASEEFAALRKEYLHASLDEHSIETDPFHLLARWLAEATNAQAKEANAMVLSTIDSVGAPHSRVVLLKELSREGPVFFTNYESAKSQEIEQNPAVALLFFWSEVERQVRLLGRAERLSAQLSDRYFASRPRGAQIGAHVSRQSQPLSSRQELEKRVETKGREFKGQEVPRPDNWGGYLVRVSTLEFWQGRENRLHDRIRFTRNECGGWGLERLWP